MTRILTNSRIKYITLLTSLKLTFYNFFYNKLKLIKLNSSFAIYYHNAEIAKKKKI